MKNINNNLRLPSDFRKSLQKTKNRRPVYQILREFNLSTVCEEARCPNIGECFSKKTATFMIMGDRCTRRCHFCSVTTKKPKSLDPQEPQKLAQACDNLKLEHIVITSVDRDDLQDYGAEHFCQVVKAIKQKLPHSTIELLVPDFKAQEKIIDKIHACEIKIFGHNIESVERLYKKLRPQSCWGITQKVLALSGKNKNIITKSGLMVGVGEEDHEVLDTLSLLRDLGVEIVTIGQYLRPSIKHWPVARYVSQNSYDKFIAHGQKLGFSYIFAGPFVRSSYNAKEAFEQAQKIIN